VWKISGIVSGMENIPGRPDVVAAREALAGVDDVQRAVRDTPWPVWLYVVNAVLLGAMALTFLLDEVRTTALWVVALAVVAVNVGAGYRMGTPWVLPRSRGFLAAVAVAGCCVLGAFVVADLTERARPVVGLAVAAGVVYLLGCVAHFRSTRRVR
jgi:hypothetical protein